MTAPITIPDAAVQAAWAKARNAWMSTSRHGTQNEADAAAVSALLAALPHMQAVTVMGLEWRSTQDGGYWTASETVNRQYSISYEEGKFWANWDARLPPFETGEAAKAAAQADYDARIRSAIVFAPSPDVRREALEEGERIGIDKAVRWHEGEISRLDAQIADNDEYCHSIGKPGGSACDANAHCENIKLSHRLAISAIRALSAKPAPSGLPQDVINLVIAAREACDTWQLPECEFKSLDKALDAFSERVPYENEPEASA